MGRRHEYLEKETRAWGVLWQKWRNVNSETIVEDGPEDLAMSDQA